VTGTYAHGRLIAPPVHNSAQFGAPWGTWFKVLPAADPNSPRAVALVHRIRTMPGPFTVMVTGLTAQQVNTVNSVCAHLPLALAVMALVTFLALFLMTGSLIIPVKALILSAASLSATFGVAVWVFQQGHLSGVLGFTPSGYLDVSTLLLMFCLAFGLFMDYQVFLLSRIREEFDLCGDTRAAVAMGLERTGRIVTAAAALLAIVFIALGTSGVGLLKLLGGGIAVALVLDATLIRALLLPALMRLLGSFNWWAPAPLRWLHDRTGRPDQPGEFPAPVHRGQPDVGADHLGMGRQPGQREDLRPVRVDQHLQGQPVVALRHVRGQFHHRAGDPVRARQPVDPCVDEDRAATASHLSAPLFFSRLPTSRPPVWQPPRWGPPRPGLGRTAPRTRQPTAAAGKPLCTHH